MMLSLLIVYLSIQERESSTDFLTEIYNRKQLDHYIKDRVRSKRQGSFSIILIDLDKFKEINDKYGHDIGDEALQDTVEILQSNLRHNDFLARYGGDEFLIVMDIHTPELLEATIHRLKESFKEFNQTRKKPYLLSFSSGYYLYNKQSKMSAHDLLKLVDQLMYQDKERSETL
jgi:diguanylate cyclase (GGDEF)-like protein